MTKKYSRIDGFIPRRPIKKPKDRRIDVAPKSSLQSKTAFSPSDDFFEKSSKSSYGSSSFGYSSESTNSSDFFFDQPTKKKSRKEIKLQKNKFAKKPRRIVWRVIKWFFILVIFAVIFLAGYMAYRFVSAGGSIFNGNMIDIFNQQPLKQDKNGRSNFLILGTSDDDPGHDAPELTDSMMVLSVDQNRKNAYVFSIPRDLYVSYGRACNPGYYGKINAYYGCINDGETELDQKERLVETQKFVGKIFDLEIQYGLNVNYTVLKEAVDAVGGIEVDIQGSGGAPGILDRNNDWRCDYKCYYVKYDNGVHSLDGEHALYLALARGNDNGMGTYGLGASNFDREINQQKILIALRDKALTTGTLTNFNAVIGLIESLGNNLRTNIEIAEIGTLIKLAGDIDSGNINSISLVYDEPILKTGTIGAESVVLPSSGLYEYDDVRQYIAKKLSSDPIVREEAPIVVLNGTDQVGLGQEKADILESLGYNINYVDNAPEKGYTTTMIYEVGDGADGTITALEEYFKVESSNSEAPISKDEYTKIVLVIGSDQINQE